MAPMAGSSSTPCASCKLLRRRCTSECVFAPYFPAEEPGKFAMVHRVFGASNVSKMLQDLPPAQRADAVSSLVYEAGARMRDPVYGCVAAISHLQQQVSQLQVQLAIAQAEVLCVQPHHGRHDPRPPAAVGLQHMHHHHGHQREQEQKQMRMDFEFEDQEDYYINGLMSMQNGMMNTQHQLMLQQEVACLKKESMWT